MGDREGTPDLDLVHTLPLLSQLPAVKVQERVASRKKASRLDRRQALEGASPSGPLNATDQPLRLLKVSIRHFGDTAVVLMGDLARILTRATIRKGTIMTTAMAK